MTKPPIPTCHVCDAPLLPGDETCCAPCAVIDRELDHLYLQGVALELMDARRAYAAKLAADSEAA